VRRTCLDGLRSTSQIPKNTIPEFSFARIDSWAPAAEAISGGVLPAGIVDAAREELRRRLGTPKEKSERGRRQELDARLERLRRQHEWGDLSDAEYRSKRASISAEMAVLPDENKVVLFDRNRRVMTDMAQNVARATPEQRAGLARLLIERAVAKEGAVAITWAGPARPFFEARWWECPQGVSSTRPLSDDDPLVWYAA
jgi:inorganic triphosphatase YgiF